MDPVIVGSIISGVGSLVGGILGGNSQDDANEANLAWQREMATSGVQMRVRDAKRAGISPLAAMGANLMSPSPVVVGSPLGDSLERMGQNVGRAVAATSSVGERAMAGLQLERGALENELLRLQVKREQSAQIGPGFPIETVPHRIVATEPGKITAEAGAVPGVQYERTEDGGLVPLPSSSITESIEDNPFHQARHFFQNNILKGEKPAKSLLPEGAMDWRFIPLLGWKPVYKRDWKSWYGSDNW